MPKPLPFKEKFAGYSDEKLVALLRNKGDYVSEAVEAAKELIQERNLSETTMQSLSQQLAQREKEKREIALTPLTLLEKIAFVMMPIIGIGVFLIFQVTYHEKGYAKKGTDALTFTLIGFAAWIILLFTLTHL